MTSDLTLEDTYGDPVRLTKAMVGGDERWFLDVSQGATYDGELVEATASFTRRNLHELHDHLTAELGMCVPTPVSPLSASRPAADAAKASRNRSWDVV